MRSKLILKKSSPFFLLLLPLFFVLHGYTENFGLVTAPDALSLLALYCVVALFLAAVFYFVFRSWRKAALYTVALFAFHFFFGSMHDRLKAWFPNVFLSKYSFILPVALVLFVALFISIKRSHRTFVRTASYLNTVLVILVLIETVMLGVKATSFPPLHPGLLSWLRPCSACDKPDVYLIIADEYAGQRQLKDQFGYDNSPFFDALTSRGFHVVPHSRSNYNFTPFSLASITNFSYLPIRNIKHTLPDEPLILRMIENNTLTKFFYQEGYTVYNNGIFDILGQPRQAWSSLLPAKANYITAQTFLSRIYKDLYFNLITRFKIPWFVNDALYHNKITNEYLLNKTLQTAAKKDGPKFCYTHLQLPHPPFYFDSAGRELPADSLFDESNKRRYLDYLKYSNTRLLALVDGIQKASSKPPVIVLMSDHGFRNFGFKQPGDSAYYFSNLIAISLPQKNYASVPDSLSAVNVFRMILNTEFNQHLPLLADSTFYLKD